jgi:hypothetical protein
VRRGGFAAVEEDAGAAEGPAEGGPVVGDVVYFDGEAFGQGWQPGEA